MTRVCSIFRQILQWFPRLEFEAAAREHKAERHARGFTCRQQFVAMLFCQLGHAQSLREICGGLAATEGKLRHLGILDCPKTTTLSYANAHRPWQLYQSVFYTTLERCRAEAPTRGKRKFRFKHKLLSRDASMVGLCAASFDWAQYKRTKGAEAAPGSGPRRLSALLCGDDGRQDGRHHRSAQDALRARHAAGI